VSSSFKDWACGSDAFPEEAFTKTAISRNPRQKTPAALHMPIRAIGGCLVSLIKTSMMWRIVIRPHSCISEGWRPDPTRPCSAKPNLDRLSNASQAVHHPANIRQTSPPPRVFGCAIAATGLLFVLNSLHNGGTAAFSKIAPKVFGGITETITNGFRMSCMAFHDVISPVGS
jgi:hypothetical protein